MKLGNQTFKVKQQKQKNMYVFEMQHNSTDHRDLGKIPNFIKLENFLTRRVKKYYINITNAYSEFITSASITIPSTISLSVSLEKHYKMKNKGFVQMMLSSFFLSNILEALVHFGYNPVTQEDKFCSLQDDYPMIAQLFKENPKISRYINPMVSIILEKNSHTYFHRMFLLYFQYMDDAYVKEEHYKALKNFYNKDSKRGQKHLSHCKKLMTFTTFFKIVYNYNGEQKHRNILDKVAQLNIFTLKKEDKKVSHNIMNYYNFNFNDENNNLEITLPNNTLPLQYDFKKKNDIKDYFEITDTPQDAILLKMFWAALQKIHDPTIFGVRTAALLTKRQALNLFASILFCNKRKNETILPKANDENKEDDDEDLEEDSEKTDSD